MATAADEQPAGPDEPLPCAPCRGTGQVISNLGGEQTQVTCPWCEGGGVQIPGHNAQDRAPSVDARDPGPTAD